MSKYLKLNLCSAAIIAAALAVPGTAHAARTDGQGCITVGPNPDCPADPGYVCSFFGQGPWLAFCLPAPGGDVVNGPWILYCCPQA